MSGATENRFVWHTQSHKTIILTPTFDRLRRAAPNSQSSSSSSSNQPGQQQQRQQLGTQRSSNKGSSTNAWRQNKTGTNTSSGQQSLRTGLSSSSGTTAQATSEAGVHVPVNGYNAEEVKEYMRKGTFGRNSRPGVEAESLFT